MKLWKGMDQLRQVSGQKMIFQYNKFNKHQKNRLQLWQGDEKTRGEQK